MRRALLALASASALGVTALLLAGFMWPDVDRELNLGPVEAFAPGSVTSFYRPYDGDGFRPLAPGETVETSCTVHDWSRWQSLSGTVIHLVRSEDGAFIALSGKSAHLGEMVAWRPDYQYEGERGWFFEPCHNDTYATDGTRVFGPTPRGLDRFDLRIEDGRIIVDPTEVTRGSR